MESLAKTLKQMLREFWLPFIVAIVWTVYVIWAEPANLKTIITAFGPAFFLASWMTGQFFRVRKQQGIQTGLSSLETRLADLVEQLESQTEELTHVNTGGDSYCYFGVGVSENSNMSTWTAVHQGKYPLYNVTARIVDLAKFKAAIDSGNPSAADIVVHIGDIAPNQASMIQSIDLGPSSARDFNIFFSARNGFFSQLVRFRRVGGEWRQATSTTTEATGNIPVFLKVDDEYPLDVNGNPEGI